MSGHTALFRAALNLFGFFCILLLNAANGVGAQQPSLNGNWAGTWVRNGDALEVTMHFKQEPAGWTGSFDSDRLRVIGIPLSSLTVKLPTVEWKIVGDATKTTFKAELHGGILTGEFDEEGSRGTFRLQRTEAQAPQPVRREITFHNGDVLLSGTVLLPSASPERVPAIVFVHGSGPEARYASKYLATRFARAGIAALIFDKRGVGKSTADWRTATPEELAGDAAAAVVALRNYPPIDPNRIGIHGHSQGGTLIPLVFTKAPNVAFVLGSAAGGLSPAEVEIYSVENSINLALLSTEESALAHRYVSTLIATAFEGAPRQQLLDLWEQVKAKPWAIEPPPENNYYWFFSRNLGKYEPAEYWRRVSVPVLLVYGAKDERVPPQASAARITASLLNGSCRSVTVHIFPDADHTFRLHSTGAWPATAQNYPEILIDWTRRVTRLTN